MKKNSNFKKRKRKEKGKKKVCKITERVRKRYLEKNELEEK